MWPSLGAVLIATVALGAAAGCAAPLDRRSLEWLAAIRADYGQPVAARALNGFAAQIGDRCDERRQVPQLIGAADGLG